MATRQLPCSPLANIQGRHDDTWNILEVGWGGGNENTTVEGDGQVLCVRFPEGSRNPSARGRPVGGVGFYAAPRSCFPALDVELRYKLKFDDSFQPQRGGKLPGIFMSPGNPRNRSGGSGGNHCESTASARVMWRAGWQAEAYVYGSSACDSPGYKDQPGLHLNPRYGDSLWRGVLRFRPGVWNDVAVRVRLNTVGRDDGRLRVTVNGTCRELATMRWRSQQETVVSAVMFHTFYGGSKPQFDCPCNTCIRFTDVEVERFA